MLYLYALATPAAESPLVSASLTVSSAHPMREIWGIHLPRLQDVSAEAHLCSSLRTLHAQIEISKALSIQPASRNCNGVSHITL